MKPKPGDIVTLPDGTVGVVIRVHNEVNIGTMYSILSDNQTFVVDEYEITILSGEMTNEP